MDYRVLIVQAMALLYWESTIENSELNSRNLVNELIKSLPAPDNTAGTEDDRFNHGVLRDILLTMVNAKVQKDKNYILNTLKLNIRRDPELRADIESILSEEVTEDKKVDKIKMLQEEITTFLNQKVFKEEVRKILGKCVYADAGPYRISDMAKQIIATMEPYVNSSTNDDDNPNLNGKGNSEDLEDMAKHFTNVQVDVSPESVIKTGWQAFNRMCGEVGGLRRGNMYVIGARPSNGKSLVSSCISLHTMLFNKPFLFDDTKKPCVLHISTENDIQLNLKIWFKYLWEMEYNEECNIVDMDPAFMAQWFQERISKNGYSFKFYHIDPSISSYPDVIRFFIELEAQGYEIQLAVVDYLAMINGDGLGDENKATWIRQLFKVLRNYCNPRKITLITPHQVATDSAMLLRQGTDDFVRQVAGKRYWADCRSIDMEVDMEVIVNIEIDGDKNPWMSFGRGKDRSSQNTPEADKFFFIPFSKYGGLRPDINDKDSSRKSIKGMDAVIPDDDWI